MFVRRVDIANRFRYYHRKSSLCEDESGSNLKIFGLQNIQDVYIILIVNKKIKPNVYDNTQKQNYLEM